MEKFADEIFGILFENFQHSSCCKVYKARGYTDNIFFFFLPPAPFTGIFPSCIFDCCGEYANFQINYMSTFGFIVKR